MGADERFSFQFMGCPANTFHVVSFKGNEGLSQLYEYKIELVSSRDDLDIDDAQGGLGVFTLQRKDGELPIHGAISRFEQLREVDGSVFYRVVLSPRLWRLTLTSHNQVFLNKSAPEFLADALKGSHILFADDFEFRLTKNYPKREYVCQFNESHYQFIARWLEREGMYYFFEQTDKGEKLIIADNLTAHEYQDIPPSLYYFQARGLNTKKRDELCSTFICEQNTLPGTVKVKDYNYRMPLVNLQAEAEIDESGFGERYIYGDNFKTTEEAQRQTTIRAEEAKSQKTRYRGRSTAAFLRAGSLFKLNGHYRSKANADYLPVLVKHEGSQTNYLMTFLGRALYDREAKDVYSNTFLAIPANVQYRAPRRTQWPKFYGVINAVIDAEGSGQYAELDDQGRYKVRLPFDLSNKPDGKASSWIRMAAPYGGAGHGMHFPLHKGTEVLLTFIDGDVDRPVIAAAAPNTEQPSIVKDANAPASAIRSAGGNQLVFGDKSGQEFVGMYSPFHKSGIAVGSSEPGGGGSITMSTEGKMDSLVLGESNRAVIGGANSFTFGNTNSIFVGLNTSLTAAMGYTCDLGSRVGYTHGSRVHIGANTADIVDKVSHTGIESLSLAGGTDTAVATLQKQAKKALKAGMAAGVAAGTSLALAANSFEDSFLKGAQLEHASPWLAHFSGGIGAACGIPLAVYAQKQTKKIAKAVNDDSTSHTASIKLDKEGAAIIVDSTVNNDATFTASVRSRGGGRVDGSSSISISENAKEINITNLEDAKISLEKGTKITVESKNIVLESRQDITLKSGRDIKLKFNNMNAGGVIKVRENGNVEIA